MVEFMREGGGGVDAGVGATVEERNLLSVAYKNMIGSSARRGASCPPSSEGGGGRKNEEHVSLVKEYKSKVEKELSQCRAGILNLLDSHLAPSAAAAESKVFYLKMKGDYHRYLAEFKVGDQRKTVAEDTILSYKAAQGEGHGNEDNNAIVMATHVEGMKSKGVKDDNELILILYEEDDGVGALNLLACVNDADD
ncbi:hypothetical protein Fmac_001875 [Flemingia macrophylla]|uniref:14-3-3 domain-containing protein n=1 Tax=Flemingia macrophylla TaxID=520843 RepID=A0ABD1NIC6_9FABA